jgi:hypothetical protein
MLMLMGFFFFASDSADFIFSDFLHTSWSSNLLNHAAPMIGDGWFEYMSGLIGLMAKRSLLKSGV